jgi:16S rRNA (guanine966-N2)-methyltransferase
VASSNKKSRPGRLRIVAGKWRSRLLDIADVPGLRPTSERVRETLFNWLAPSIPGAVCLDLFAGTGALGLEALSRGAGAVVFVEKSPVAAKVLRANVKILNASTADVRQADALELLAAPPGNKFDIVFLDPPFAADMLGDLCRLLDEAPVLGSDALVYLEEDRARPETDLPSGWRILKSKTAGNVRYSLAQVDQ